MEDNLNNFTEFEKKGLLGKIIKFFTARINWYRNGIEYTSLDFNQKRLKIDFSSKELKFIYKKIMECEQPNSIIEKIPLLTSARIDRIYMYLFRWRKAYLKNEDMSGFLCGFVGNMRQHREKNVQDALNVVENNTNTDMRHNITQYLGGKQRNKTKIRKNQHISYFKKTKKICKRKRSRKGKHF